MLNLYLLKQTENDEYDTYDSAVVVAETEDEARLIHPNPSRRRTSFGSKTWVDPEKVEVILLGEAIGSLKRGVVCSSYNAG